MRVVSDVIRVVTRRNRGHQNVFTTSCQACRDVNTCSPMFVKGSHMSKKCQSHHLLSGWLTKNFNVAKLPVLLRVLYSTIGKVSAGEASAAHMKVVCLRKIFFLSPYRTEQNTLLRVF